MRRSRLRRKNKKQLRIMVIGICCLFLVMTAGYAAMQTELNISAKGNVVKKGEPAIDLITNLVSTNSNELYYDDKNNVRYYGANPNNYVTFNNELWRIIGVIDGKVKIIKNESIGTKSWASNGSNNWNDSDLKAYLNGDYYNNIESTSRNMVQENAYYLGSPTSSNYTTLTASEYYDIERSDSVYSGNPTSTIQSIGLMYPSDYGYAAGSSCLSTALYSFNGYNGAFTCMNSDYLHKGVVQWLQVPHANYSNGATALNSLGYVVAYSNGLGYVDDAYSVFPVLYLKNETQIISGDGTENNPFILEL